MSKWVKSTIKLLFRELSLDPSDPSSEIQKKVEWYTHYLTFMESIKQTRTITKLPILGHKSLDLHILYKTITDRGGIDHVYAKGYFRYITPYFNLPKTCTNPAHALRTKYLRFLKAYENSNAKFPDPQDIVELIKIDKSSYSQRRNRSFGSSKSGSKRNRSSGGKRQSKGTLIKLLRSQRGNIPSFPVLDPSWRRKIIQLDTDSQSISECQVIQEEMETASCAQLLTNLVPKLLVLSDSNTWKSLQENHSSLNDEPSNHQFSLLFLPGLFPSIVSRIRHILYYLEKDFDGIESKSFDPYEKDYSSNESLNHLTQLFQSHSLLLQSDMCYGPLPPELVGSVGKKPAPFKYHSKSSQRDINPRYYFFQTEHEPLPKTPFSASILQSTPPSTTILPSTSTTTTTPTETVNKPHFSFTFNKETPQVDIKLPSQVQSRNQKSPNNSISIDQQLKFIQSWKNMDIFWKSSTVINAAFKQNSGPARNPLIELQFDIRPLIDQALMSSLDRLWTSLLCTIKQQAPSNHESDDSMQIALLHYLLILLFNFSKKSSDQMFLASNPGFVDILLRFLILPKQFQQVFDIEFLHSIAFKILSNLAESISIRPVDVSNLPSSLLWQSFTGPVKQSVNDFLSSQNVLQDIYSFRSLVQRNGHFLHPFLLVILRNIYSFHNIHDNFTSLISLALNPYNAEYIVQHLSKTTFSPTNVFLSKTVLHQKSYLVEHIEYLFQQYRTELDLSLLIVSFLSVLQAQYVSWCAPSSLSSLSSINVWPFCLFKCGPVPNVSTWSHPIISKNIEGSEQYSSLPFDTPKFKGASPSLLFSHRPLLVQILFNTISDSIVCLRWYFTFLLRHATSDSLLTIPFEKCISFMTLAQKSCGLLYWILSQFGSVSNPYSNSVSRLFSVGSIVVPFADDDPLPMWIQDLLVPSHVPTLQNAFSKSSVHSLFSTISQGNHHGNPHLRYLISVHQSTEFHAEQVLLVMKKFL